jgi:hypothetical protein
MTRIVILSLWAAALQAQTVQGVAINSATHKPVAAATVQLVGPADEGDREIYRTVTDAAGRFHFERVAPGRYRAIAEGQGFTRMLLPQGDVVARAPRISVDASTAAEISIPMVPASVISGRVSDQDGDPLRYVSIEALQHVYRGGKKVLDSAVSVRSNDRGEYRLFGLPPGRYYVRATLRARGSTAYSPLFFPAARDISQAPQLEVAPGAELRSVDIVMRPDSLHSISGRVVDAQTGQPVPEIYVIARLNAESFANGGVQLKDSFTIADLLPGKYVISAQQFGGNAAKAGRLAIDLGNGDVTGIVLPLSAGLEVTGSIRGLPAGSKELRLFLQPENPAFDGYSVNITDKGAFSFRNVRPDVYHLVWTLPKGVYVQSIKMGDRTLRDDRVDLNGTIAPLAIQLAGDGARVQGTVRNASGEPVPGAIVSMSADPSYDVWSAICDDAGHFEIRDIAPGEYKLLAFEDAPQGAPQDPDFRKPFEKSAVTLQVFPSTQQKVDLVAVQ